MYQMCLAKQINPTEDIFAVLEYWLKNYSSEENDVFALVNDGSVSTMSITENQNLLRRLKEWSKDNNKIVIATSCSILVLAASQITLNSPIASITNRKTNETTIVFNKSEEVDEENSITSGLYQVDDSSRIVNEEGVTPNLYINTIFDNKGENRFLFPNTLFFENILQGSSFESMIEKQLEAKRQEQEQLELIEQQAQEELRLKDEKKYIEFYCEVYGLDYEKVFKILSDITDNFTSKEYLNNYVIGPSTVKGHYVNCTSKEMALLIAVRNLYYAPEMYNYNGNDLRTYEEYQTELDYSHQIGYISNVLGVDPVLNWAICNAECSFSSPMFRNKHNPAGLRYGSEFATFPSTTAGFVEESLELLKYKIVGKTTIASIGAVHAPTSDPSNSVWVPNVQGGYSYATNNYETLFGGDKSFFANEEVDIEANEETDASNINEEECIKLYCAIYGLKYDKVYELLREKTNDFQSSSYLKYNTISLSKIDEKYISCNSKEEAILLAIRNIYNNPAEFGFRESDIKINTNYNSSLSYAEQIAYFSNILGVDPSLNYAICRVESGFNSPMFTSMHNPAELKKDGEYMSFPNNTVGFIEQTIRLLQLEINKEEPVNVIEIGYSDKTPSWKKDVITIYSYVSSNFETVFGEDNTISNKIYALS